MKKGLYSISCDNGFDLRWCRLMRASTTLQWKKWRLEHYMTSPGGVMFVTSSSHSSRGSWALRSCWLCLGTYGLTNQCLILWQEFVFFHLSFLRLLVLLLLLSCYFKCSILNKFVWGFKMIENVWMRLELKKKEKKNNLSKQLCSQHLYWLELGSRLSYILHEHFCTVLNWCKSDNRKTSIHGLKFHDGFKFLPQFFCKTQETSDFTVVLLRQFNSFYIYL